MFYIIYRLEKIIGAIIRPKPTDYSKGTYLLQKGQYDQAIAYIDKAISGFSKAIEIAYTYNNRGDALAIKGHFNKHQQRQEQR